MGRTVLNTADERPYISKSKFLSGSQCKKLLWNLYNARDEIPEPDAATQSIFDQGHEVGALAKSLYSGGIEVGADVTEFDQVLQRSLEAIKARKPLFEAGFVYNGGFARADILNPVGEATPNDLLRRTRKRPGSSTLGNLANRVGMAPLVAVGPALHLL